MKLFLSILVALTFAISASAAGVYTNAMGQVVTVAANGSVTVAIPAGTAATHVYGATAAQTVTNGMSVALIPDAVNILTGTGEPALGTNTITLSTFAAADVGKLIWVAVAAASTNDVGIAQSGNYDGPAIVLVPGQMKAVFVSTTTSVLGQ